MVYLHTKTIDKVIILLQDHEAKVMRTRCKSLDFHKSLVHFQNKVEIGGKNNNCCYFLSTYEAPGIVLGLLNVISTK